MNHDESLNSDPSSLSQVTTTEIYLMVGIHIICTVVAVAVILFFTDSLPREKHVDSATQQAKRSILATLKQLKRKRQLLMTVLNVYAGLSKSLMLAEIAQVSCCIIE